MQNYNQVEKIIDYLKAKIANLKEKKEHYNNPIMQEMLKGNTSLQMEYMRLQARIDEIEDNLLAIEKFSGKNILSDGNQKRKTGKEKDQ